MTDVATEKPALGPKPEAKLVEGKLTTFEKDEQKVNLPTWTDSLKFTVPAANKIKPEQAELAGNEYYKAFEYAQVGSDEQAQSVCDIKGWTLKDFVNDALKAAARSSAYQSESSIYAPSTVSADDIKERMVRDYIRLGVSEDVARQMVTNALAAIKG